LHSVPLLTHKGIMTFAVQTFGGYVELAAEPRERPSVELEVLKLFLVYQFAKQFLTLRDIPIQVNIPTKAVVESNPHHVVVQVFS